MQHLILRDGALGEQGLRVVLHALYTSRAQLRSLDLGYLFPNDNEGDDDDDDEEKHVESAVELRRYLLTQRSTLESLYLGYNEWHNVRIIVQV